jgi:hypothetical protein
MAWGFDFPNLRPEAYGVNYLTVIEFGGGYTQTYTFTSDYVPLLTAVNYQIVPSANISVTTVMEYPAVTASIAGNTITVQVSGGNVPVRIFLYGS